MSINIKNISGGEREARGYSYSTEQVINYKWEIHGITSFIKSAQMTKDNIAINSSKFSSGSKLRDLWHLQLKIEKDNGSSKNKSWISLYLQPNHGNQKFRTKFFFYMLDNKKQKIVVDFNVYNPLLDVWFEYYFYDTVGFGTPWFVKIDELFTKKDELFQNDTLTVGTYLIVYDDYVTVDRTMMTLDSTKRKLCDDFKELFLSKKRCDVVINVGNEKFHVHKLVLITRSSVFDAMFSHDMKENKENEVNIPDIDPQIFKKVIDYIYTDTVDGLDGFAEELLEAADKYQLNPLKEICESFLSKTLNAKNAIRLMILADRHNAERLKNFVINYIAINFINFKNTGDYKLLEETHPILLLAILKKYANGIQI